MDTYSKNAPTMYEAMSANVERFKSEEESLLLDFTSNTTETLVTADATIMTGGYLATRQNKTAECVARFTGGPPVSSNFWPYCNDAVITRLKADIQKVQGQSTPQDLKTAIATEQAKSDQLKGEVDKWNEDVALMHLVIQQLPDTNQKVSKVESLAAFGNAAKTLKDQPLDYVDSEGKKQTTTVGDVLITDAKQVVESPSSVMTALPDAPGVDLEIVNLGLGLLKLKQAAAQAQLAQSRAVRNVLVQADAELATAQKLLTGNPVIAENTVVTDQIRQDIQDKDLEQVSADLIEVRKEAVAEGIVQRVATFLPLSVARLSHLKSITDSQINDQQYQVVVHSGINGLVAYHEGGLTSQEIANVISFAQAVGVGVLAGRVH